MKRLKQYTIDLIMDMLVVQTLEYSRLLGQRSKGQDFEDCKQWILLLQKEMDQRNHPLR